MKLIQFYFSCFGKNVKKKNIIIIFEQFEDSRLLLEFILLEMLALQHGV